MRMKKIFTATISIGGAGTEPLLLTDTGKGYTPTLRGISTAMPLSVGSRDESQR